MATIDYKQKIKDYMNSSEVDTLYKSMLNNLFPELKESEDERIRKSIIGFLITISSLKDGKTVSNEDFDSKAILEWVAWLEKQGEHANFRNKIQIGDKVTRNEDGVLVNLSQLNRVAKKQDERNLANSCKTCKDEPKFRVGDTIHKIGENTIFPMVIEEIKNGEYVCDNNHSFINIKFQDDYELVEQKSTEWSEKIKGLDELETYILSLVPNRPLDAIKVDSKNIRFLINKEQKPWSEEDEVGIANAMLAIEQARTIAKDENDMGNLWYAERWLKSLKERYTWKPSDEQMKALEYYIKKGFIDKEGVFGKRIVELHAQLKKLREK